VVTARVKDLFFLAAKRSTSKTVQAVSSTIISGIIGVKSVKLMNSILLTQELSSSVIGSRKLSWIVFKYSRFYNLPFFKT
jgi:hypothetical protein